MIREASRAFRPVAAAITFGLVVLPMCSCVTRCLGGASSHAPLEMSAGLSAPARDLIRVAFRDVEPARLLDCHVHIVGVGTDGSGCLLNDEMRSVLHPVKRMRFAVYMSAAGVSDMNHADREFVERLVALARAIEQHGRYCLLAFDARYRSDGTRDLENTEFYVPNERVFALATKYPDIFVPVMSVHPYRRDACHELEKWARRGARMCKWLPNAMGIDPSSPRCEPFYAKMKELGVVLLTHAGEEKAVEAEDDQRLGNPLLLRRPLDKGVKVIVAHCAGLGDNEDLDAPERPRVPNFDLFMRLFDSKRYEGLLFADISAMTQFNRIGRPLTTVLARADLQKRLVNGSDYPLPAVNVVIRTGALAEAGYITEDERASLNEIYDYNPLLFDYVLKRTLRAPGSGARFGPSVFMANPGV